MTDCTHLLQQRTRLHWIQCITFAADGVQSRLGGYTYTRTHSTNGRRAPQYLLRSLSGGEGNNSVVAKRLLRSRTTLRRRIETVLHRLIINLLTFYIGLIFCLAGSQGRRNLLLWFAYVIPVAACHTLGLWQYHTPAGLFNDQHSF